MPTKAKAKKATKKKAAPRKKKVAEAPAVQYPQGGHENVIVGGFARTDDGKYVVVDRIAEVNKDGTPKTVVVHTRDGDNLSLTVAFDSLSYAPPGLR